MVVGRHCGFCIITAGALLVGIASSSFATPLSVQLKNDSGLPDSQVYIGFIGGGTLSATNANTGASLSLSTYSNPSWYMLDTLPKGINLNSFSGRIYVGYGSPWTFNNPGYEPPPTVSGDANYLKRYDKMELTYTGNAADVADTTSLDYFSIPIALKVFQGGLNGTVKGSIKSAPTQTVVNAVKNLTSPASAAIVTNNGQFVRAIGPGVYPPTGGLPASPYDNFDGYLSYLRNTYSPAHSSVIATISGYFGGVGPAPTTPQTKGQNYTFTASIDANKNITLTGSGGQIGGHTILFKASDLENPTGIYGANAAYYLDGSSTSTSPQNDVYGWMAGDLLAGLNIGALGSTVVRSGTEVGQMPSQQWFSLSNLFAGLQPAHANYYNQYAAALAGISDAYNFAYSDRFAPVTVPLDPARVDTLLLDIGDNLPEPVTGAWVLLSAGVLLRRR